MAAPEARLSIRSGSVDAALGTTTEEKAVFWLAIQNLANGGASYNHLTRKTMLFIRMVSFSAGFPAFARVLFACLLPLAAVAQGNAESAVENFLLARSRALGDAAEVALQTGAVKLDTCAAPAPFLPAGAHAPRWGRMSVGLRCSDGSTRYLQAEVKVQGNYVVPARAIAAGTVISADMLTTRRGDLASLPRNAVSDPSAIAGKAARQMLAAGKPVQSQQLSAPLLVKAGQAVTIQSSGPGFRITRAGEAIDPGSLGDAVRVRVGPRQNLDAVVIAAGEVSVDF
jgi:flagella basal body P-ring formation protein FlgA